MRINRIGIVSLLVTLCVSALDPAFAAAPATQRDQAAQSFDERRIALGKRMYREGVLPSGETMSAFIQGDIAISGQQVICGYCHRRSGIGSSEGQDVVPPVTGDILYQPLRTPTSKPPLAPVLRPAYTDELFKRAIRDGIDSAGRLMKPLMPRYPLSDADLDILIAYIKTLNTAPSPGVTDHEMHFATVVPDTVDPATRKAFLDVFETYFEQKNVETRNESQRAEHAPRHKEWVFGPYRKWVLHIWELQGSPETWTRQLEEHYRQQPVFAVLSGIVPRSSRPVHDFCQDAKVPCLFPITDLPVIDESDFYVLYFSKGMTLEAQSIDQHLSAGEMTAEQIVQVYREGDPKGATATMALQHERGSDAGDTLVIPANLTAEQRDQFWSEVRTQAEDAVLVLWLDRADLEPAWKYLAGTPSPARVYLSTTMYQGDLTAVPNVMRERVYFVQPSELTKRRHRLLARSNGWLRFKRIYDPAHEEIQANAFFALKLMGETVKTIRGFFVREYLLERFENMVDNASYTSIYPRVSLAPGQRFVVKGAYIAKLSDTDPNKLEAVTDWMIPRSN